MTTPDDFTQWTFSQDIDNQGEAGLIPSTTGTRKDGETFYLNVFEDGEGGLTVSLHTTAKVGVDVIEADDNDGTITYPE
jgi:hypothetical protein